MNDHRPTVRNTLVFGGYGSLGRAIADHLERAGARSSNLSIHSGGRSCCHRDGNQGTVDTSSLPVLDAVVWAHGVNVNDASQTSTPAPFATFETNVTLIAETLHALVHGGRIADGARLWSQLHRETSPVPGSFPTRSPKPRSVAGASRRGPGARGALVNAVLPGIVETPMTRRSFTSRQIDAAASPRLSVGSSSRTMLLARCLPVSAANTGITGQSISVDLGFSVGRSL